MMFASLNTVPMCLSLQAEVQDESDKVWAIQKKP